MASDTLHTATPKRRRMPILVRHAITLTAVFIIALPLSYIVGQCIIRARQLDKLTHADDAIFEDGLGYLFNHAPTEPWALDAAVDHIDTLEPGRATRVLWGVGNAFLEAGTPLPDPLIDAGQRLIERAEYKQKFVIYDQLAQLGAGEDPQIIQALNSVLKDPDDRRFIQAVEFYDANFLWLREMVPTEAWQRWGVLLSHSTAPQSQLHAAKLLGDLVECVNAPDLPPAFARLVQSDNAAVRGEVLDAVAGYARIADDPVPYEQVLITLTQDANETIARRAWITLGLLNPLSGFSADWRSVEPTIAEAMLWAAVKTNPDRPEPAVEALADLDLSEQALLALALAPRFELNLLEATWESAGYELRRLEAPSHIAQWRALLALHETQERWREFGMYVLFSSSPLDKALRDIEGDPPAELLRAYLDLLYAASYRLNSHFGRHHSETLSEAQLLLLQLSAVEGACYAPASYGPSLDNMPYQNRFAVLVGVLLGVVEGGLSDLRQQVNLDTSTYRDLFALAAALEDHAAIHPLVRSPLPAQQRTGVIAAGLASDRPQLIDGVTAEFARAYPWLDADALHSLPNFKLEEFGLARVDALTTLLEVAETAPDRDDRYEQIALLKLALWMRGDLGDDFIPQAEAMLADELLPTSTVLMCLLHMQRPAALFYLFDNPDAASGEPPIDLYDLFVNQRWWHVFSRLVPDADLDLWLWGDPGAQAFQFEVMRQWVQVNRWRLEAGWWPGGFEIEASELPTDCTDDTDGGEAD
ncbi:MAG: hypothetical protein AAGA29_14570 [Planctomycetota bacterium]